MKNQLLIILTIATIVPASAMADTDPTAVLNNYLDKSGAKLTLTRNIKKTRRVCDWNGDIPPHNMYCHADTYYESENYKTGASVKNGRVVDVKEFKFLKEKQVSLPATALVSVSEYRNCGLNSMSNSISLTVAGTEGWSITKAHSVSSSRGINFNQSFTAGIPGVGSATTSLGVSQSVSLSDSSTATETSSKTVSRSNNVSVTVQPKQAGLVRLTAYQVGLDVPFEAKVIIDGDLVDNVDGYKLASSFLDENTRTIQFNGVLHLTGVSAAEATNYSLPDFDCSNANEGKKNYIENTTTFSVPASVLKNINLPTIPPEQGILSAKQGSVYRASGGTVIQGGETIGTPDGIQYTITSTSEVTRMDPACGFNDIGLPNGAKYIIENRHYENYVNGVMSGSWDEEVEVFSGCSGI